MFSKLLTIVCAMLCMSLATPAFANTFLVQGQAQDPNDGHTVFTFSMSFGGPLWSGNQPGHPVYYQIEGPVSGMFTGVDDPSLSATIVSLGPIADDPGDDPCVNNLFSYIGSGILGATKFGVGCGLQVLLSNGDSGDFTGAFVPSDSIALAIAGGTTTSLPVRLINVQDTTGMGGNAAVPEPGSLLFMSSGLAGSAAFIRRRWFTS